MKAAVNQQSKAKRAKAGKPEVAQFVEILNLERGRRHWMKLHTSLLDDDAFASLEDSARMLIVALWLYAARVGQHVFPADPKWLQRKIPLLNSPPDLQPLLEARDMYGNPAPFVQYVDPPTAKVQILGRRKIEELRKELQAMIDWMPIDMPELKVDVNELCRQAALARRCLQEHKANIN